MTSSDPESICGMVVDDEDDEEEYEYEEIEVEVDEDDDDGVEYEEIEIEEEVEDEEVEVEEEEEEEEVVEYEEVEEEVDDDEDDFEDDDEDDEEDDDEEEIGDEPVMEAIGNGVNASSEGVKVSRSGNRIDQSSKGKWKDKKKPKKNPLAPKGVLGKKKKVDQSNAECFFCKKKGHWKRNCKEYLATLKDKIQDSLASKGVLNSSNDVLNNSEGKKEKVDQSDAECFFCKKKGHWKRNCKEYLSTLKDKKQDSLASKGVLNSSKDVLNNSKGKKKVEQSDDECLFCKKKGHWKRSCKEYLTTLKNQKQDSLASKGVLNSSKDVLNNSTGKKKKVDQSNDECKFCKKKGHWKRNCKEYLATLKDKKQGCKNL